MSSGTQYRYFKTILVFTVFGSWAGAVILTFFMNLFLAVVEKQVGLLLNILVAPITSLGGIVFFFPPALLTGIIAALLRLKRKMTSLIFISVIGAILSFIHATLLFEHGTLPFWLMFAGLGVLRFLYEWSLNISGR